MITKKQAKLTSLLTFAAFGAMYAGGVMEHGADPSRLGTAVVQALMVATVAVCTILAWNSRRD